MPSLNLSGTTVPKIEKLSYELSPQQKDVLHFVRNPEEFAVLKGFMSEHPEITQHTNANLIAVAGSGKTTTLIEICKLLQGSTAFCAFNKKIADEVGYKLKMAGVGNHVRAATFHSFGFQAWRQVAPRVRVDAEKLEFICGDIGVPKYLRGFTKALASISKQAGVGMEFKLNDFEAYSGLVDHYDLDQKLSSEYATDEDALIGDGIEWTMKLLAQSIEMNEKMIDFDDMMFAPLYHRAAFFQNDWVLIDEAQDTNTTRRLMAREMLRDGGRLIAVGDPRQAIYGFTGADANSLDLIAQEFGCITLPLTVTYRCPKSVVRHAQRWVKHIEAAPEAPEGLVRTMDVDEFDKLVPEPTDAILCRNTKPLIQLALGYLRKRVAAHVEGRDIGASLLSLVRKWKRVRTVQDLVEHLEEYLSHEVLRLMNKGQEGKIPALQDKIGSLFAIMDTLNLDDDVEEVVTLINSIFKDTEGKPLQSITLSTVHKAKGREWDRVYLYGRNVYMPSPFAKQGWQLEQENNLIYVAVTRAKAELIEVRLLMAK